MAVRSIEIRSKGATNFGDGDIFYSKTDWSLILNKPSSYTPIAHSHGNISDGGLITATAVPPVNTDYLLISDTSNGGKIERGLAFSTSVTEFLRRDGSWAVPANSTTLAGLGITASASELNILDGVTATYIELNYCAGVTSNIQDQLNAKASSGHAHGAIGNTGLSNGVPITVSNGDSLMIVDSSASNGIVQSNIVFGSDALQFLSNAGSWQKPIVRDVLTSDIFVYNTTYIDSGLEVTLDANSYYQIMLVGSWGRFVTATASALRCSWTVDNTTGGPTHNGYFEFGALDTSTSLTMDVVKGSCSMTAGGTYNSMSTASASTTVVASPLGGFISVYTGTSAKVLKLRIQASVTTTDGVYLTKGTSLIAIKVG